MNDNKIKIMNIDELNTMILMTDIILDQPLEYNTRNNFLIFKEKLLNNTLTEEDLTNFTALIALQNAETESILGLISLKEEAHAVQTLVGMKRDALNSIFSEDTKRLKYE